MYLTSETTVRPKEIDSTIMQRKTSSRWMCFCGAHIHCLERFGYHFMKHHPMLRLPSNEEFHDNSIVMYRSFGKAKGKSYRKLQFRDQFADLTKTNYVSQKPFKVKDPNKKKKRKRRVIEQRWECYCGFRVQNCGKLQAHISQSHNCLLSLEQISEVEHYITTSKQTHSGYIIHTLASPDIIRYMNNIFHQENQAAREQQLSSTRMEIQAKIDYLQSIFQLEEQRLHQVKYLSQCLQQTQASYRIIIESCRPELVQQIVRLQCKQTQ